jgi:hypothetical protein
MKGNLYPDIISSTFSSSVRFAHSFIKYFNLPANGLTFNVENED